MFTLLTEHLWRWNSRLSQPRVLWVLKLRFTLGKLSQGPSVPKCPQVFRTQPGAPRAQGNDCAFKTQKMNYCHITGLVSGDTQGTQLSCLHCSSLKIVQDTQSCQSLTFSSITGLPAHLSTFCSQHPLDILHSAAGNALLTFGVSYYIKIGLKWFIRKAVALC